VARDPVESGFGTSAVSARRGSTEKPRERESRRVPRRLRGVSHVASRVRSSEVGKAGLRNREWR
jgi:hypothetical protein